jgi:hypothetical protein
VANSLRTGTGDDHRSAARRGCSWAPAGSPFRGDGSEAYTRAGNLKTDANGVLQTSSGNFNVLGEGGPIALPPDNNIAIAPDGTVFGMPRFGAGAINSVNVVGRIKLVNPPESDLVRGDDGLFRTRNGAAGIADEAVTLAPGGTRGQQRQFGGRHGADDQPGAPVRDADQDAADGGGQRPRRNPACSR